MVSLTQPITPAKPKTSRDSEVTFEQRHTAIKESPKWASKLNASLEIRDVLSSFFKGITQELPLASLRYRNSAKNINIEIGSTKTHTAKYGLKTSGYELGDITFSRTERFSEDELKNIENALSHLFYPLRNALLYKEALDSSLRDSLTGLSNRAAFELAIKRELSMAKRHNQALSMIVVDIDHFKHVNDSAGHQAGDQLLRHVAQMLQSTLRETDQVFRFGGEEFVILLASANLAAAHRVAERSRSAIANSNISVYDRVLSATVSMGISVYSSEDERDSLFERADEALYFAKKNGRNCIKTEWDVLNSKLGTEIEIEIETAS